MECYLLIDGYTDCCSDRCEHQPDEAGEQRRLCLLAFDLHEPL